MTIAEYLDFLQSGDGLLLMLGLIFGALIGVVVTLVCVLLAGSHVDNLIQGESGR